MYKLNKKCIWGKLLSGYFGSHNVHSGRFVSSPFPACVHRPTNTNTTYNARCDYCESISRNSHLFRMLTNPTLRHIFAPVWRTVWAESRAQRCVSIRRESVSVSMCVGDMLCMWLRMCLYVYLWYHCLHSLCTLIYQIPSVVGGVAASTHFNRMMTKHTRSVQYCVAYSTNTGLSMRCCTVDSQITRTQCRAMLKLSQT